MTKQSKDVIGIVDAKHVGGYRLRLKFNDGKENEIDFESFLSKSLNPMIKAYLQRALFKSFSIEYGDLVWNDYDLCFPIADLYEGCI
ncbi:MAG: DUF2442 domain-containing protein [bacterium]|nr:DUF2442 domain-containing protein [bacterium]